MPWPTYRFRVSEARHDLVWEKSWYWLSRVVGKLKGREVCAVVSEGVKR